MDMPEVQVVFYVLYAFGAKVSQITGVRMPAGLDPQHTYGQVDTEASQSEEIMDQQALLWRARELWRRDAEGAPFASREAATLLQHLAGRP